MRHCAQSTPLRCPSISIHIDMEHDDTSYQVTSDYCSSSEICYDQDAILGSEPMSWRLGGSLTIDLKYGRCCFPRRPLVSQSKTELPTCPSCWFGPTVCPKWVVVLRYEPQAWRTLAVKLDCRLISLRATVGRVVIRNMIYKGYESHPAVWCTPTNKHRSATTSMLKEI